MLHLSQPASQASWEALGVDPWVVLTMIEGYRLQFLSTPPVTTVPAFSIVADHKHREGRSGQLWTSGA